MEWLAELQAQSPTELEQLITAAMAMEAAAGCHSYLSSGVSNLGRAGGLNGEPKEVLRTSQASGRRYVAKRSPVPDNRASVR